MLHRIIVDVVEVTLQIHLVPDRMLPEFRLPNAPPGVADASIRLRLLDAADGKPCFGKLFLDPAPALREISVRERKRPDGVKVVGQKHDRLGPHGPTFLALSEEGTE